MPLTQAQIQAARAAQHAAAHDPRQQVRVVAGPGTGKSATIEERISWLLMQGVQPTAIYAVSYTRASALDLRERVHSHCVQNGQPAGAQVRISTLHSLALRTLRAAELLTAYPVEPIVMDGWELENVFDAEFGHMSEIGKTRREKIRIEHEAFWGTGQWGPPNYVPPNPAITAVERAQFAEFHGPRTQAYSCVLPGEIVRQCVQHMVARTLDAVGLLNLQHLVVDEFQDLNPMDLLFVDSMITQGAMAFVAGDDDQSIYSFRFASPAGIQNFIAQYPHCGQHTLNACFRSTPSVLAVAQALIGANPQPNRIHKNQVSLYSTAAPPLTGSVHRWRFQAAVTEARAVAESCRDLIAAGIHPRDVLVLLSNQRALLPALDTEFHTAGVAYEPPRSEGFLDSPAGRLVLAMIRIVSNVDDYVAHRVLLGSHPGVGVGTCNTVSQAVIANNLNYRSIYYQPLPGGVFSGRALTALGHARTLCAQIQGWQATDTVGQRMNDIAAVLTAAFTLAEAQIWQAFANTLPGAMTLAELRDYLWADTDEQQELLLHAVLARLNLPIPAAGVLPARVRVMTMHGAKGLSAKIVFVPGLEEAILPGHWRQPYPGLVLEAVRLLYVSVTRARAARILSYAQTRILNGQFGVQPPSRFVAHLGGAFGPRAVGLSGPEVTQIMNQVLSL